MTKDEIPAGAILLDRTVITFLETSGATYRNLWHSCRSGAVGYRRSDLLFWARVIVDNITMPGAYYSVRWKAGDGTAAREFTNYLRATEFHRSDGLVFIFPFFGDDYVLNRDSAVDDHIFSIQQFGWTTGTTLVAVEIRVYYLPAWQSGYRTMIF